MARNSASTNGAVKVTGSRLSGVIRQSMMIGIVRSVATSASAVGFTPCGAVKAIPARSRCG
jgi:hypothetical protein